MTIAREKRRAIRDWAPAIPFFLIAGGVLIGSAVWLIRASFAGIDGGWTIQPWADILGQELTRKGIANSLGLSAWVATICTVIGTPLAYYIAHLARRGRTAAQGLLNVVTNFGGASLAIAMVATLGAVGFVRLLARDWLSTEITLNLFSFQGLIVTYLYFILPLYVLLVLPAMAAIKPEWWEAVQTAAGSRWDFWRKVGGPVMFPFVLSGWVLTFAWSIGQFSVPFALLGEVSTTPLITTRLGNFLFSATGGTNRFQRAAALAVLLMVISAVALLVYRAVANRMLSRLEAGR